MCVCVRACVCVCVLGPGGDDGGSCSVSCVRVCSKGYFFEEILSMELYLFKTF